MITLKGKNQIGKFKEVAERLVLQISSIEGVAGIVLLGGLTRNFADNFSDLDITVFLTRKDERLRKQIRKISSDEEKLSSLDVDLLIHCLSDFRKWKLSEVEKWDYSKAKIVFDPKGEISEMLARKLRVPESSWLKQIAERAEYIKWYCCPPRDDVSTIAESWIGRGDMMSAQYCLNYAVDLILQILFAINREFLPAQKWRLFYSYSLNWVPADFRGTIEEALIVRDLSTRDFDRRMKAIRRLWREIAPKVEQETGLTLNSLSKHYVKTILDQTEL